MRWDDKPSEIERMLQKEQRDQKRVGRGVHNRVGKGSDKAGVRGSIRYPKHNFKRNEKNSKTTTLNMYETVLLFNDFDKLSDIDKKTLLIEWRKRFSSKDIYTKMDIGEGTYYNLLSKYDVYQAEKEESERDMTPEQLEEAKKEVMPRHEFNLVPKHQKFDLIEAWQKELGYKTEELANMLEYKKSSFSSSRTTWRKARDQANQEEQEQIEEVEEDPTPSETPIDDGSLFEVNSEEVEEETEVKEETEENDTQEANEETIHHNEEESQIEQDPIKEEPETKEPKTNQSSGLNINYEQSMSGRDAIQHLHSLSGLIKMDRRYNIKIKIDEVDVELDEDTKRKILELMQSQ